MQSRSEQLPALKCVSIWTARACKGRQTVNKKPSLLGAKICTQHAWAAPTPPQALRQTQTKRVSSVRERDRYFLWITRAARQGMPAREHQQFGEYSTATSKAAAGFREGRLISLQDDSEGGAVRWQACCAQSSRGVSPQQTTRRLHQCRTSSLQQMTQQSANLVFPAELENQSKDKSDLSSGCSPVSKSYASSNIPDSTATAGCLC